MCTSSTTSPLSSVALSPTTMSASAGYRCSGDGADGGAGCRSAAAHFLIFRRLFGALHVSTPLSVSLKICRRVTLMTRADLNSSSFHFVCAAQSAGFRTLLVIQTRLPRPIRFMASDALSLTSCVSLFVAFRRRAKVETSTASRRRRSLHARVSSSTNSSCI